MYPRPPPPTDAHRGSQVRRLAPLHWHAAGCTALAWGDGGSLLSGGHEGVLLVWRLQTAGGGGAAGKPAFLPRLGGAVTHLTLAPDGTAATVTQCTAEARATPTSVL